MPEEKLLTTREAMEALQNGWKITGLHWAEDEYIQYIGPLGVRDENMEMVNASVLLVNTDWKLYK